MSGARPRRYTDELTIREIQILTAYSVGLKDAKEVAELLGIGYETVRTHEYWARLKLAAKNRTHAVALALRLGVIN